MDENAGPGRQTRKSNLHVMWGGVWVELGEAEFLVEDGRIVKVLSFTPKEFHHEGSDNSGEAL